MTPEKETCEHNVVAKFCFRCKRPDLAVTPEKETPTRKTEFAFEVVPDEETPTCKGVEEVVAEFTQKTDPDNYEVGEYHYLKDNGESLLDTTWYPESSYELDADKIKDWLRTTLLARDAVHKELAQKMKEERLAHAVQLWEVVREILTKDYFTYNGDDFVEVDDIKTIAAKHGITNL